MCRSVSCAVVIIWRARLPQMRKTEFWFFSVTSVGCTKVVIACGDTRYVRDTAGWNAATVTVTSKHSVRKSRCSKLIYYEYSTLRYLISKYNIAYVPYTIRSNPDFILPRCRLLFLFSNIGNRRAHFPLYKSQHTPSIMVLELVYFYSYLYLEYFHTAYTG